MANYATLKAAIQAAIKQNDNNEITGNLLQQQLLAMVNSLGVGYQYAGIATPATNPGTPDQNVFYLASTAGTYVNFGGLVLADGEMAILKYNGAWSIDSLRVASLEKVSQFAQKVGNGTLTKVNKGSADFVGFIWDGTQIVQANATFNGLLFEVVEGEYVSINTKADVSRVALPHYPTLGQTDGTPITGNEYVVAAGINYILVTVDVSASTSAHDTCILYEIPSGALGSISDIQRDLYPQEDTVESYDRPRLSGLVYDSGTNRVVMDTNSDYGAYLLELRPYAKYNLTPAGAIVGVYLFDRFPTMSTTANKSVGNSFNSEAYKYALIDVAKNNASINVETGPFYLFNDRVQEINEMIGKELIDRIYTSSDYSGLMWDGSAIYSASANFNSFIIKVEKGREYRVAAARPILSVAAFENYPVLGSTDGVTLSGDTFDFSFVPSEGQNYIVVTIPLVSGTTQISLSSMDSGLTRTLRIANPLSDKKIISFGDSLTDFVDDKGYGYAYYMGNMSGADCLCAGFGGARISKSRGYHVTPTSDQEAESAFDLPNLFSAIINNNWTAQDNAVNYYGSHLSSEIGEKWRARVAKLKAVDWSQVDTITIFAGTNDWANAVTLGTSGSDDETCVLGAINVITQMITANFPKVRVYWFTPIVRWIATTLQDRTDANWSDNYRPGGGITLREFSEAVYNEVLKNHLPCYDTYNRLGWTKYNFAQYFIDSDGTHPYKGFEYIGKRFASVLQAER